MIITFAGHSKMVITNLLQEQIEKAIQENMQDGKTIFLCGGYGAFDDACAGIVEKIRCDKEKMKLVFVTPYRDNVKLKEIQAIGLYDEILYPDLENVPYRFAILKRNEYMVDKADLLICYVNRHYGGAYQTAVYAKRKKKHIINLADGEIG